MHTIYSISLWKNPPSHHCTRWYGVTKNLHLRTAENHHPGGQPRLGAGQAVCTGAAPNATGDSVNMQFYRCPSDNPVWSPQLTHMQADPPPPSGEITQLLWQLRDGENEALSRLLDVVYPSLRRLAAELMAREKPGHTLGPTALVHEMLLTMLIGKDTHFENRAHFFTCTAHKMRQILIDHARKRKSIRHGGAFKQSNAENLSEWAATDRDAAELFAIDDLIEKLEHTDPRAAQVMELRYFWGYTVQEVSEMLGVSEKTVERDWKLARGWLRMHLSNPDTPEIL